MHSKMLNKMVLHYLNYMKLLFYHLFSLLSKQSFYYQIYVLVKLLLLKIYFQLI
jgi:hypothetical protein